MLFGGKKKIVGLEIDTEEARAVVLGGTATEPNLLAVERIALPDGAVEDGMINKPGIVGQVLTELKTKMSAGNIEVLLGVANQNVLVRFANFPRAEDSKMDQIIRFQAQEYIPFSMENLVLDYLITGEVNTDSGEFYEVMLVAAQRDMIDKFVKTIDVSGWNLKDIDVASTSLLRSAALEIRDKVMVVLDISNGLFNIMITVKGMPRLVRLVSSRMKDVAEALECPLGKIVPMPSAPPGDLVPILSSWGDALADEVRSSIKYYQSKPGADSVDEILLSGRGARIWGLTEQLEDNLRLPVKILNPINRAGLTSKLKDSKSEEAPDFAIATGLALRGLEE